MSVGNRLENRRRSSGSARPTLQQVKEYWESYADRVLLRGAGLEPREHFERLNEDHQRAYAAANRRLLRRDLAGKSLLELGCGMGFDTISFARAGARVVAIDLSEKCLELTRERLDWYGLQAELTLGNAEQLNFPAASFDVVAARGLLMFTPDPVAVLDQILKVLRPDGRIQAILHKKHSWYVLLATLSGTNLVDPTEDPQPNRLYTGRQVQALFQRFVNVTIQTDRFPTLESRRPGWAAMIYNMGLVSWVQHLPRRILEPFGYYFIVDANSPASAPGTLNSA